MRRRTHRRDTATSTSSRRSAVASLGGIVSVRDQIDTASPMGKAMFTIIGAMAELESSLISERVTAGMKAARARGKQLGRPRLPLRIISEIETMAAKTNLSVRAIQTKLKGKASRGMIGEITKRVRATQPSL